MSQQEVVSGDEYVGIADLLERSMLERVLEPYHNNALYAAIFRYYDGCIDAPDDQSLQRPLALLKEALATLLPPVRRRRGSEQSQPADGGDGAILGIHQKVSDYGERVATSVDTLRSTLPAVPKKLHFVWLGGGVGEIQRDYIKVWEQVMARDGYQMMLWYDADGLLAYETHRVIVQAAKASAMAAGGVTFANPRDLRDLYIERLVPLKEQLFIHLQRAQASGRSADEARIQLLVHGYGQDEVALRALRERHADNMAAMQSKDLLLRDLSKVAGPLRVADIYQRELNLRGNFAGASDVVRAEVLYIEGGLYSDVDNLPPLLETIGGVNISQFGEDARLGVLQLLLDNNPDWMPGRQKLAQRYTRYFDSIPQEHRAALLTYAQSAPQLHEVFQLPENILVRPDGLRAVAVGGAVSNSYMAAHSGSRSLDAVIDRYLVNYEVVKNTSRRAVEQNISPADNPAMLKLALAAAAELFGPLHELPDIEEFSVEEMAQGAADYYSDGVIPGSESTIYLTGPIAMIEGVGDYEKSNLTPRSAEELRLLIGIKGNSAVNRQTEEEQDHSWKEQAPSAPEWLVAEQARWQEGNFQARYKGDLAQLLNRHSIEFDAGWPLIEGRHVLSSAILQQLLNHLGAPFLRAMSEGSDALVTFDTLLPLSFDDRQAILAQDTRTFAPAPPSDATTQALSIIEVLERIASQSMPIEQLTSAQRLQLGQLLGLASLDNRSFAAVAGELDNLANKISDKGIAGRYAVIEEQLYKYKSSEFVAGLASMGRRPAEHGETALMLKKNAIEKPLSLRQWGAAGARIQQMARDEFREQLVVRAGELMDGFNVGTTKFVPQDLLFDGFGDTIGRRCYPLVLAMAAAAARGDAAITTLRERFFMSVVAPEDIDSRTFVQAIHELHSVQEHDVGNVLGRSTLRQVVDLLALRTTTSTLLLNSDNHSMLLARTWVGEVSTYHFYDPNLGIIGFSNPEDMHSALKGFFEERGMAVFYGAYGEPTQPSFDLIELHGEQIAQTQLSSGLLVEQVLLPGELKGVPAADVRNRLASARGESLLHNPKLGKSLMSLDSHWWGEQINQASSDLLTANGLTPDFIPVFETLEIAPDGGYHLTMIKPQKNAVAEQTVQVSTDDPRFLRIKNHLTELFEKLTARRLNPLDPTGAGAVHTLNAGFAIQALMNALRGHEGEARSLTLAVRLHAYVNYAQLLHGLVSDMAGIVNLVRQGLAQERLIAQASSTAVGEAFGHVAGEGVGTVLGLVNVGFDIYQLSESDNDADVARFGTQLAFDSASVVLGAAAMGAGLASAATAAAFLGGASVIIGGLAVGIGALAEGFSQVAERSKQVGIFFHELDQAYRGPAFTWNTHQNAWQAHPRLMIKGINLRDGRVFYDSQRLFPLRDHFGVPDFDVDYGRAINVRQSLGLPGTSKFAPAPDEVIILPCTPQTFYGYDYHSLPFALQRHDLGFDVARRLEKRNAQGNWQFRFSFYSFPGEYIVQAIHPVFQPDSPTFIQVVLDDVPRTLVVPMLLKSWQGQIVYEIEAGDAAGRLMLNQGVNVMLKSQLSKTLHWTLLAPWATESDVQLLPGAGLKIGDVTISYSGKALFDFTLHLAGNTRFVVDPRRKVLLLQETAEQPGTSAPALQKHFKELAREHRLELPFTPVHEFLVPFDDPAEERFTTAYYDAGEERFLYIQDDDALVPENPVLGAVVDGSAYFYHPQGVEIYQTDVVSGLIIHRYRLMLRPGESTVKQCVAVPGGGVRVVQHFAHDGQGLTLDYLLTDEGVFLTSLTREVDHTLEDILGQTPLLADWKSLLGDYIAWPNVPSEYRFETSIWQLAVFVSIHWKPDASSSDMSWVRSSDGLIIRPLPQRGHARGWRDSDTDKNQSNLLAPGGAEGDVFAVYTRDSPRLCVQRCVIVDEQVNVAIEWKTLADLKNVLATEEGCVALTEQGVFYELTAQGELQLAGVNEVWFKERPQWWAQLPALVAEAPFSTLTLIGLSNASGDARLCAWYVEGRLLLADLGGGTAVRLLGVTPDNAAAWLFDVSRGQICRQVFVPEATLAVAFGDGSRLLAADALPAAQPQWTEWLFSDVKRSGAGLLATTVEGLQMQLNHQEPALLVGVDRQWAREHAAALAEQLKALAADSLQCAPLLTVASAGGQQWFVTGTGRLLEAASLAHPEVTVAVGTQQQNNVLLFDAADGLLRRYPLHDVLGPLSYLQRDAELLTVDSAQTLDDLLPLIPDDVSTLILRLGGEGTVCRLSQDVWRRLESVIIDCRPSLGGSAPASSATAAAKLEWRLDTPAGLIINLVDEHVVILDPDTCHSLILREANATDVTLRGDMVLAISGYQPFTVASMVTLLADRSNVSSGELLNAVIARLAKVTALPV
ncbi:TcdA/TcdB pore-forming domain-containing protein [Pseudomonas prosekii]|nr:TcdA/TcdB pore-forming domain-containing protein [Pseudomonas prosekii]